MINSDDPRLTAYVLGELDDAERAEIAVALAASPELQAEVDSIRQAAELFDDSLRFDASRGLTEAQRLAIQEQSSVAVVELADRSAAPKQTSWRRAIIALSTGGIAASILAAFLLPSIQSAREASRRIAAHTSRSIESEEAVRSVVEAAEEIEVGGRGHSLESPLDTTDYANALGGEASSRENLFVVPSDSQPKAPWDTDNQVDANELQWTDMGSAASPNASGGNDLAGASGKRPILNEGRPREGVPAPIDGYRISAGDHAEFGAFEFDTPADPRWGMAGASGGLAPRRPASPNPGGMEMSGGAVESLYDEAAMSNDEDSVSSAASAFDAQLDSSRVAGTSPLDSRGATSRRSVGQSVGATEGTQGQADEDSARRRRELSRTRMDTPRIIISKEEEPSLGIHPAEEKLAEVLEQERLLKRSIGDLGLREDQSDGELGQKLEELARVKAGKDRLQTQRTWRRSQATPNASRLIIGDQDELLMEGMQANVMVDGFRARVLLDLYYFNDRGRQLEGNFKLRLPDDASLYYFAFGESAYEYRPQVDQLASKGFLNGELVRAAGLSPKGILEAREGSWSKVKEARVVPREKAAHAYSETVRRRVDPALVEWSGAGMFNARVFPLMPNKLHRVVVGYDLNLQQVGDDFVYRLDLPEDVKQCIVDLNVSALPGTAADIQPTTRPFVSSGRAYYHFDEVKDSTVELRFSGTGPVLLKGNDPQAGDFFAARVTPTLPAGEMQAGAERATFLVDTSLSSRPDKFNVWLSLLEAVLTKNRETLKQFSVLFFNIDSHWWKEADVDNTPENIDALMTYCHSLSLEGATDLRQALREATAPSWAPKDIEKHAPRDLFLLSDGAVTWGEMNVYQMSKVFTAGQTLFAYKTGMAGTSTATLEHLTRETGGAVFSIVNEDEVAAAATAHRSRPWKLIDVTMAGGTDLLVAGRPQTIYPGQSLLIVGRGEPDAEAMIKVSRGEGLSNIPVQFERVVESDLAARAYGQVAVGQLEDLGSTLEDVSVAYARHFRVTGQTCSLLMLDSEADYQRFNIKPEDDVFVVRSTPSADLIAKKLDELAEQLGDAKASVVAWLDKLQNTAGFQFELPTALRLAIDRLPQSAFDVEPPRLKCESHQRGDFPKEFIEQLDSGKLEYDSVTAQANQLLKQHGAANGLKMLSSLIEQNPGDPVLTRDVAYSAIEWGLGGQAFPLLHRVASMRPYEPQSYIAMAQCLADIGHADLAMVYYEVALNARWHDRYKDIHDIAGIEYLRLLRRIQQGELSSHAPDYAQARLESLVQQTSLHEADLVVTMMWNTDRTDVDLHVLEPTGEECFYNHPTTRIGGHVTRDVTEGLGPEMYTLPKAKPGSYKIMANYFGSDANRTQVRTKVYITVYKDFGSKREQLEKKTITLSDQKEKRELTTVVIQN